MELIDKSTLVAEIEKFIERAEAEKVLHPKTILAAENYLLIEDYKKLLSTIDTFEVNDVDLELITGWFDHIAQIADDRMTLTNQRMTDAHALDEIKCLAKNSSEFITKHYKAQKGE